MQRRAVYREGFACLVVFGGCRNVEYCGFGGLGVRMCVPGATLEQNTVGIRDFARAWLCSGVA